ncbi:MATE family efflux transporter [Aquibacillus sp. 3ASR75-11]|uniref:Probable multidrug resistance protein NorM n=1 Tax=Terrihalobacillus insolitus TaxID=2950438 RepID=A0A9X3WTL6_9BACI|nr:MATE family efflux transporter [Terrihalobacillus insolitus]MDC3412874.1 MATE family efflux transporter [Terrihalobacillus insolitus]MDC3423646.1 MATE family efflux transporter [Terrihalobacillus insolitus]
MKLPFQAKRVFQIAAPAIGESYLQSLLGVIDSFFIARLGLLAINAVGITNIYSMTYIGVFTAISATLSVFLSRSFGAKNTDQSKSVLFHGLLIATIIGLLFSVLSVLFSNFLLNLAGADDALKKTAFLYFNVVLGLTPFIALFTAQSAAFRAIGDTRTPFRVGVEMNIVHVIFDYILIFGLGPIKGFGLAGAAVAMILARVYAFLRLFLKSQQIPSIALSVKDLKIVRTLTGSMTKFAIPAVLERLSMRLGQVVYFGLIVRMGTETYATHNIAGTLTTFSYTIGGGFAIAATTLIGQSIGEDNIKEVKEYRKWSYLQSAFFMTVVTALLALFSPWIGRLFTDNSTVISLLTVILLIDTIAQPFLASVLVDTSAVQAGGNSSFPMIVTMIGIWGVRTLGVYFFAWKLGFGLPAVWISIAADNALRAILFSWYRRKKVVVRGLS